MQLQPRCLYVLVGMLQAGAHAKPRQDATRTCDGVEGVDPALSSTPLSTMPRLSCRLCDRSSAMMDGSLDMARPAVLVARRGSGDQASGSSPADDVTRTHAMRWYASRTAVDLNTKYHSAHTPLPWSDATGATSTNTRKRIYITRSGKKSRC